jgi:hypothetical protein
MDEPDTKRSTIMIVATEQEKLSNRLTTLEARAAGLRPAAAAPDAPHRVGLELREIEREHAALLFEYVKAHVREILERGPGHFAPGDDVPGVNRHEPLCLAREKVGAAISARLARLIADETDGLALPPVHEAENIATTITEGVQ